MGARDSEAERSSGDLLAAWITYVVAVGIGLLGAWFVPFTVMFTDGCSYHACREHLVPWALFLAYGGIAITLLVTGVLIFVAGRRGRSRFQWAMVAVVGVLASSCGAVAMMNAAASDPRPDVTRQEKEIEAAFGQLPGVQRAFVSSDLAFSATVVLTEEATAEQTKAIVQTFRDRVTGPEFDRWDIDITLRRDGRPERSFTARKAVLDKASDQAVRWLTLQDAFPADEVKWNNYAGNSGRNTDQGIGDISLKLSAAQDFTAISATYARLAREFPELSPARWEVSVSGRGVGFLYTIGNYPTELELSVWHRLNADQNPAHTVRMALGYSISEQLESSNPADAEFLAEKHLPIVAELATPIEYTAAKDFSGAIKPTRPLNISLGGCTSRAYTPSPVEQKLADRYEKC